MGNEVFYKPNGKLDARKFDRVESNYKGTTLDGDAIHHWTYYDPNRQTHISYDTVVVRGEHFYIQGSGHEVDGQTGKISQWQSWSNQVTWKEALGRRTQTLIIEKL